MRTYWELCRLLLICRCMVAVMCASLRALLSGTCKEPWLEINFALIDMFLFSPGPTPVLSWFTSTHTVQTPLLFLILAYQNTNLLAHQHHKGLFEVKWWSPSCTIPCSFRANTRAGSFVWMIADVNSGQKVVVQAWVWHSWFRIGSQKLFW